MSMSEKLYNFEQIANKFFNKHIKSSDSGMPSKKFNKFRLYFLNIIIENLSSFFDTPQKIHLAINVMQIAFNIWSEIVTDNIELKNELFTFFFMASCFIAIKLESPQQTKSLKNWACDHDIDLNFVFRSERIILSRSNWKICIDTPAQMQEVILSELFKTNNEYLTPELEDCIFTWLQFGINEYDIYYKYDMLTLTLSSCYLGIMSQNYNDETKETIKNKLLHYLKVNTFIDIDKVQKCSEGMYNLYESNEEDKLEEDSNDDIYANIVTRSNSQSSLCELFDSYDKPVETNLLKQSVCSVETEKEEISFLSKKRKNIQ